MCVDVYVHVDVGMSARFQADWVWAEISGFGYGFECVWIDTDVCECVCVDLRG